MGGCDRRHVVSERRPGQQQGVVCFSRIRKRSWTLSALTFAGTQDVCEVRKCSRPPGRDKEHVEAQLRKVETWLARNAEVPGSSSRADRELRAWRFAWEDLSFMEEEVGFRV